MHPTNIKFQTTFTVFPQDCNYMPPMVFGGKVLSEMDICAAMTVKRVLYHSPNGCDSAVTVAVDGVTFFIGAVIGDLIFLEGEIIQIGIKSLKVKVTGHREPNDKICEGTFTFVSRRNEKPFPHGLERK